MRYIAEHAFYAMVDMETKKFIKTSEIRRGTAGFVDHGNPMDVWNFFKEYFGQRNETKYLPMFIHTHPIGAAYFSSTDMDTLESYAGLVAPMKMGMQVVTESLVLTRVCWIEPIDDFKIRKQKDKDALRQFFWKEVESQKVQQENQQMYTEIRDMTYVRSESLIQRIARLMPWNHRSNGSRKESEVSDIAKRMKERGFLNEDDY